MQQRRGPATPVEIWMQQTIHSKTLDMTDPNESDTVLLSNPPSLTCKRYAKMTAYGNHWRVDDETTRSMGNFDSGVACLESTGLSAGSGKDYVGILQDILVPDYGDLKTPVTVFSCVWKKRVDNHNNSTYVRDPDGFLVVNFKHNISRAIDPYVFPSQCNQVFWADDDLRPPGSQWKVVLKKDARSKRTVEEDDEVFLTTTNADTGAVPSSQLLNQRVEPDLTGAIVLNDIDNAIALQSFDKQTVRTGIRKDSSTSARNVRRKTSTTRPH